MNQWFRQCRDAPFVADDLEQSPGMIKPWGQCGGQSCDDVALLGLTKPQGCSNAPYAAYSCASGFQCIRKDQSVVLAVPRQGVRPLGLLKPFA
jgi:hypothetical protein